MDIRTTLKQAIVKELNLEDVSPEDIVDEAPLFGEGLGLDSLDAIELVVLVQRHFGVDMEDMEDAREAFSTLDTLVRYIEERRQ